MLKVDIKNISLLKTNTVILQRINFCLEQNKTITLLGKNGTGKTSLLNSLTGLLDPQVYSVEGTVHFGDENVLQSSSDRLNEIKRSKIKYVFQDALNCFDPLYKLKYYFKHLPVSKELLIRMLKRFNLPDYEELKNYYPYELSGGMAQRLAIVLAASADPDIILFDEPTANLDYGSANILKHFIKEFVSQNSKGVIVVSQDIDFALSISDIIIYIQNREHKVYTLPDANIKLELEKLFS